MCGLVGLVQRYDAEARVDPAPLAEALGRLPAQAAAELLAIATALEPVSLALVGWGGFRTLREDPGARALAADVAAGGRVAFRRPVFGALRRARRSF